MRRIVQGIHRYETECAGELRWIYVKSIHVKSRITEKNGFDAFRHLSKGVLREHPAFFYKGRTTTSPANDIYFTPSIISFRTSLIAPPNVVHLVRVRAGNSTRKSPSMNISVSTASGRFSICKVTKLWSQLCYKNINQSRKIHPIGHNLDGSSVRLEAGM